MPLQYINKLIGFQEVIFTDCQIDEDTAHMYLTAKAKEVRQACTHCGQLEDVTLKGQRPEMRKVRHLDSFGYKCFLKLPEYRLFCKSCRAYYTHEYSFVGPRALYSHDYKKTVSRALNGTTVAYVSDLFQLPVSTCDDITKSYLEDVIPQMQENVISQAENTKKLIMGVDDFAIRKGHNYNTGFHDLKNGTLLHVAKGRTLEELLNNTELMEVLERLDPFAITMDLARGYHTLAAKVFPNALRIADRFHVNRYKTDALQDVRIRLSKDKSLSPDTRKLIKGSKKIIGKRFDQLTEKQYDKLWDAFDIAPELEKVYFLKEGLIEWYDLSDKEYALEDLVQWIENGKKLAISEVDEALKTFNNWKEEIANYHCCRYTNASVEGRNNKIKSLTRRCFCLWNRKSYENRIYQECNSEFFNAI